MQLQMKEEEAAECDKQIASLDENIALGTNWLTYLSILTLTHFYPFLSSVTNKFKKELSHIEGEKKKIQKDHSKYFRQLVILSPAIIIYCYLYFWKFIFLCMY